MWQVSDATRLEFTLTAYTGRTYACRAATCGAFQGWVTHPHPGWRGEGWPLEATEVDTATGVPDARPNSRRLILEAAQRFLTTSHQLGCADNVLVFSSFLWDLQRYVRRALVCGSFAQM